MIAIVMLVIAAIFFLLAAFNVPLTFNAIGAGLFFLTVAILIAGWFPHVVVR